MYSYFLGAALFVSSHPFRLFPNYLYRATPSSSSRWTQNSHNKRMSKLFMADESAAAIEWQELVPSYFHDPVIDGRRIAKDDQYLESILQAWKYDTESEGREKLQSVEMKRITYPIKNEGDGDDDHHHHDIGNDSSALLHGCLLRRRSSRSEQDTVTDVSKLPRLPAILFFHTAAGPQDVFLYYKAHSLLQKLDCLIMICDILSDENGWGWDPDRSRYNTVRDALLQQNATLLQQRVASALQYLDRNVPYVHRHCLAAMGWCLGGQPLLELAQLTRADYPDYTFQVLISFHGVFARDSSSLHLPQSLKNQGPSHETNNSGSPKRMLLCNGRDDPYVTPADLTEAMAFFTHCGYNVEVLQIPNAKHGFTNPAQAYNTNPAFEFCKEGSVLAWTKSLDMLTQSLFAQQ